MERPNQEKPKKWKRVFQSLQDSDSSDSNSEFGSLRNRLHSTNPVIIPLLDKCSYQRDIPVLKTSVKDEKKFKLSENPSSTRSNPLLHHDYIERNDSAGAPSNLFWWSSALKRMPPRIRCQLDSTCNEGNSNSCRMTEICAHLVRPDPLPLSTGARKRVIVAPKSEPIDSTSAGPSSTQDSFPSTSSDLRNNLLYGSYSSIWHPPKKSLQTTEDSSEIQVLSVKKQKLHLPWKDLSERPSTSATIEVIDVEESNSAKPEVNVEESNSANPEVNVEESNSANPEGNVEESNSANPEGNQKSNSANQEGNVEESNSANPEGNGTPVEEQSCKEQTIPNINDELVALLECQVCMDYVGPAIYQCRRGHLICLSCKSRLVCCPTCRATFSEQRNIMMEKVAEKLKYACKYANMGCTEKLQLREREEHDANCKYRLFRCMGSPFCQWTGQQKEVIPHFRTTHPEDLLFGTEHDLTMVLGNFTEIAGCNHLVSALGELFRVNISAVNRNIMNVYGCVIYIGPAQAANGFMYSFTIGPRPGDESRRKISFSRRTQAYVESCADYYNSGDSFILRQENAVLFCEGPENTLIVKLNIWRDAD